MKIVCVGGGPANLYFSILMKKAYPSVTVEVYEQNRSDDTFGWGVVFSEETLGHFGESDAESYEEILRGFSYWDDIDTFIGDMCVTSTGHGFCGMSRKKLLGILQDRASGLGVELRFETAVEDLGAFSDADLIVAGDGANSQIRDRFSDQFEPTIRWGQCRFTWLGTDLPLSSFTFIYRENEHGLFQVHSYPFQEGLSTFIVECHEDVWRRAGLDKASEEETIQYCEKIFRDDLKGHRLLSNKSIWRNFPEVSNARWSHENIVLIGDAAHTAHFSIGSGTKLAMEDAIALAESFRRNGLDHVPSVLENYEEERRPEVARLQRAASTSQSWFEHVARYLKQDPIQFTFNETTRSKRITWDNLELRDPDFISRVRDWYADSVGASRGSDGSYPVPMFTKYRLRDLELENRIVVSPMCMYSAEDGLINDWHFVHLCSRAVGGAGLVMTEMTNVSREGRISPGCTGMYLPEHVDGWRRVTEFVHGHTGAKIGLQISHAGRKGATRVAWEGMDQPLDEGGWPIISASAIPYLQDSVVPREMDRKDMDEVRDDFARAAGMGQAAGFDLLEIHMAHGYLLSSFISPISNVRTDEYGGSVENRMRFPLEVLRAVRAEWPDGKPISVRISATDWVEPDRGLSEGDVVEVARLLCENGCDIIDVSAGMTSPEAKPNYGRMFQVPYSELIRHEAGVPTMTVGNIQNVDQVNTILAAGRADLCVLGRPHLLDPYIAVQGAVQYGYPDISWPLPYSVVRPRPPKES